MQSSARSSLTRASARDGGVQVLAANWTGWLATWLSNLLRGALGEALRRGRPMFLESVELVRRALEQY